MSNLVAILKSMRKSGGISAEDEAKLLKRSNLFLKRNRRRIKAGLVSSEAAGKQAEIDAVKEAIASIEGELE